MMNMLLGPILFFTSYVYASTPLPRGIPGDIISTTVKTPPRRSHQHTSNRLQPPVHLSPQRHSHEVRPSTSTVPHPTHTDPLLESLRAPHCEASEHLCHATNSIIQAGRCLRDARKWIAYARENGVTAALRKNVEAEYINGMSWCEKAKEEYEKRERIPTASSEKVPDRMRSIKEELAAVKQWLDSTAVGRAEGVGYPGSGVMRVTHLPAPRLTVMSATTRDHFAGPGPVSRSAGVESRSIAVPNGPNHPLSPPLRVAQTGESGIHPSIRSPRMSIVMVSGAGAGLASGSGSRAV